MTASALMGRLPTFPSATVNEVVDIRTELAPSLTQFRSAMVTISKSFSSEPWETDFGDEVHDAWVESVLPAVEAIDASVRDNKAYPGLAIVGTGLVGHLGPVVVVGGALAGIAPILQAVRNRKNTDREIRMQPFYFLYAAEQSLN